MTQNIIPMYVLQMIENMDLNSHECISTYITLFTTAK